MSIICRLDQLSRPSTVVPIILYTNKLVFFSFIILTRHSRTYPISPLNLRNPSWTVKMKGWDFQWWLTVEYILKTNEFIPAGQNICHQVGAVKTWQSLHLKSSSIILIVHLLTQFAMPYQLEQTKICQPHLEIKKSMHAQLLLQKLNKKLQIPLAILIMVYH